MKSEDLILSHGGYRELKSFQIAQMVYDLTVRFCEKYVNRRSRTWDQMVQAARSGVQNIAEGSQASATSRETEMKLTSVARASLEELRLDYEDYLRHHRLSLWDRNDLRRETLFARRCTTTEEVVAWIHEIHAKGHETSGGRVILDKANPPQYPVEDKLPGDTIISAAFPEIAANAVLLLIAVASSLLDRQIAAQAAAFQKEGGFTERLYRIRREARRHIGKDSP